MPVTLSSSGTAVGHLCWVRGRKQVYIHKSRSDRQQSQGLESHDLELTEASSDAWPQLSTWYLSFPCSDDACGNSGGLWNAMLRCRHRLS